jgi:intron-binding protein aquarius
VGHLRDIRRLVVALSRARLGLYVFCRLNLFQQQHELKPAMEQFTAGNKSSKLQLVLGETYPNTERKVLGGTTPKTDEDDKSKIFQVEDVSHLGTIVHSMQEDIITAASTQEIEMNTDPNP